MAVRVVCISRTLGAGAESIGRTVAERLAFRYGDEEVVAAAAEQARLAPTPIAEVEHRQSMLSAGQAAAIIPHAEGPDLGCLPLRCVFA